MLYYRSVTSANGDGMIEEYNAGKHDWTPGLGKFIARDIGTFTVNGETSKFRCPYLNSISYAGNRLHVSWVWRDRFGKTHPCYGGAQLDTERWNAEHVLSIFSQAPPAKIIRTKNSKPIDGIPSPLNVVDYRFN